MFYEISSISYMTVLTQPTKSPFYKFLGNVSSKALKILRQQPSYVHIYNSWYIMSKFYFVYMGDNSLSYMPTRA